jgi:hypothetical protein
VTLKDWLQAAVALIVIGSALAGVRVSMALRERDREDFEELRDEHRKDHDRIGELEGQVRLLDERTK